MSKREALGRGIRAVTGWMLRVSHHVTDSGSMDARRPGSERRVRMQPWEPERRNMDRRDLV